MPSHLTLDGVSVAEPPPSKGSRFIGHAAPIQNAAEAMAYVDSIRQRYPDATHHCFAWRTAAGDGGWRASDDGEPGGTAGRPILARIDGAELIGVVVVVVRYYGGTNLGKGGLIRGYGGGAAAALKQATVISVRETKPLHVRIAYGDQGAVQGVLRKFDVSPSRERFDTEVHLELAIPTEDVDALCQALKDGTGGRATLDSF